MGVEEGDREGGEEEEEELVVNWPSGTAVAKGAVGYEMESSFELALVVSFCFWRVVL